jgi:hypothetical protein
MILRQRLAAALFIVALSTRASAQAPGGRIEGTVTDSLNHRPLVGATVIATPESSRRDSIFHSALSDSHGRFTIAGLAAGRFSLTVEHPLIDSTGIGVPSVDVTVASSGVTSAALALPSVSTLRRTLCPIALTDSSLGVTLGVVRRTDGTTVNGATVVFSWSDFDVDRTTAVAKPRQLTASVTTDSAGIYRACGLPIARSLLVQAQFGAEQQSGVIEEEIGDAGVLVRDFHVGAQIVASANSQGARFPAADGAPARLFTVTGRVQSTKGQSIPSAQVRLFGTEHVATSDASGEFRLSGLPGGTQGIEVIALGYYPQRLRVEVTDDATPVAVRLERTTVVLDSIRVTAKRVNGGATYREFDADVRRGVGHFVTEEDIERRHPFLVSDLIRMMPGISASVAADGSVSISQNRGISTLRGAGSTKGAFGGRPSDFHHCPRVFIDGVESFEGDVNIVSPSSIYGIEVYRMGEAPARFNSAGCGAIVIWSK